MIDRSRILSTGAGAPGANAYEIRGLETGRPVVAFVTAGVNGKTADDTAIGNLADASEQTLEALALFTGPRLPLHPALQTMLAAAEGGVITLVEGQVRHGHTWSLRDVPTAGLIERSCRCGVREYRRPTETWPGDRS